MKTDYRTTQNRYHQRLPFTGKSPWNRRATSQHYQRWLLVTQYPDAKALYSFTRISFPKDPLIGKATKITLTPYIAISYGQVCYALDESPVIVTGLVINRRRHPNDTNRLNLVVRVTKVQTLKIQLHLPSSLAKYEKAILKCDFVFPDTNSIACIVYENPSNGQRRPKYQGYIAGYYLGDAKTASFKSLPIPPQIIKHPSL